MSDGISWIETQDQCPMAYVWDESTVRCVVHSKVEESDKGRSKSPSIDPGLVPSLSSLYHTPRAWPRQSQRSIVGDGILWLVLPPLQRYSFMT